MPEFSQEDLDRLFQQKSEEPDLPFDPRAWEKMEVLLDRDDRRRRVLFWWWGALGMLLLAGFIWAIIPQSGKSEAQQGLSQTAADTISSGPDAAGELRTPDSATNSISTTAAPEPVNVDDKNTGEETTSLASAVTPVAPGVSANRRTATPQNAKDKRAPSSLTALNAPLEAAPTNALELHSIQDNAPENTEMGSAQPVISPPLWAIYALPALPLEPLEKREVRPDLPSRVVNAPTVVQRILPGGLYAQAFGSGTIVAVDKDGYDRFGVRSGVGLEYRLWRRLGIGAGAVWSKQFYRAEKGEYNPPAGFWKNHQYPNYTDGFCEMLEVPVWLRLYQPLDKRWGQEVSLGAGISSFYLLEESYDYSYGSPLEPGTPTSWTLRKALEKGVTGLERRFMLSSVDLMAGYHRRFGARWRWGVEGFAQVPLKGMGHGKIELYGIGGQVMVQYRLLK